MTTDADRAALFATVDEVLAATVERRGAPGLAWGVVVDGRLLHAGGAGTTAVAGGATPSPRTLFRIASMTKSFTAATVLALRDEGALALDDPVAAHVPEATALRGPTADSPVVTLRSLLAMGAGLPSDDPWADRHLDLTDDELSRAVAGGVWFASTPGTTCTYSNLGYALLGRVVRACAGNSCQSEITQRFLGPLGLTDTVWVPRADQRDLAVGHRDLDGEWVVDEPAPLDDGAFAPMGGLWSTIDDLARWVAFFLDAYPARDGADDGPLRRASRREMQRPWSYGSLDVATCNDCSTPRAVVDGYGAGLRVLDDAHVGAVVSHSGGLPGFGSNMRWLPDRGLGLVSLGNGTYAPMAGRNRAAFDALAHRALLPPLRTTEMPDALAAAAHELVSLLNDWDDARADALFTDNVALDDSYARRRGAAAALLASTGRLRVGSIMADDRSQATFVARGEHGTCRLELQLHPLEPPRVQWYEAAREPDAASG